MSHDVSTGPERERPSPKAGRRGRMTAYLLVALYTYMIMRSMPNITIFIFAPAAALLLVYLARRRKRTTPPVLAKRGNPAWSN